MVEPALSAEQWAAALHHLTRTPHPEEFDADLTGVQRANKHVPWTRAQLRAWPNDHPQQIALHNAALPDSDPRKITREKVAALRDVLLAMSVDDYWYPGEQVVAFADALASYLPPDPSAS